jgi:hypothetical protein
MALVTQKVLLPAAGELGWLGELGTPLLVSYDARDFLKPSTLYLSSDRRVVALSVEYQEVVFKFEIFNLKLRALSVPTLPDLRGTAVFESWDAIQCVVEFQWLRPAYPGEVPASWVQIVSETGRRTNIPDTATALGVSMVGLVFNNSLIDQPTGMICSDDADPAALSVYRSQADIRSFVSSREIVAIEDFPRWKRDLLDWCERFDAAASNRT